MANKGPKVLMISMDGGILDAKSESSERMNFYATVLDQLDVIVLNAGGAERHEGRVAVYPTSRNKFLSFFKAILIGRGLLRRHEFDVISAQDPFAAGLVACLLKKLTRTQATLQLQVHTGLFTPYFLVESWKNRLYVRLAKVLLPTADCIKVVSQGIKKYLVRELRIEESKISMLPVYVFFNRFLNDEIRINLKEKYPQFDFVLLMASRLVGQKNISMALRAISQLSQKYSRLGLVIVGSGSEEENLKSEVRSLKLDTRVVFEPWTSDVASYYKTADVFLLASDYEGWARTVLEAMASGLPVVMTDVGVAGEVVENGENAVVVPVKDDQAMSKAIEMLYNDRSMLKRIGEAGRRTIIDLDLRDRERYLQLYVESFKLCTKN